MPDQIASDHHDCRPEGNHHTHDRGHQHGSAAPLATGELTIGHDGAPSGSGTTWARACSGTVTSQSASGLAAIRTVTVISPGRRCTATVAPRGALRRAWATPA